MRWILLFLVVAGCERGELERLEAPRSNSPVTIPSPPPVQAGQKIAPMPAPVPASIAAFLRTHAADPEPWRVSLYALGDASHGPDSFLGTEILRSQRLNDALATEVIDWLGTDRTYVVDTDSRACGWTTPELGIEVARGSESTRLRYNCGYLFFANRESGSRAMVTSDAVVHFDQLVERSGFRDAGRSNASAKPKPSN